ncbi:hypothetical protein AVEN_235754-1, partial [Araneus ventricosus]
MLSFRIKENSGSDRTHASEETGALNQRLRPLGHATTLNGYFSTECVSNYNNGEKENTGS